MSKFNTPTKARAAAVGPIKTKAKTAPTVEGGIGHLRDARSELFLLAVTNMVGESTFYETGKARDSRFVKLVRKLAIKDPEWVAGMLAWLRSPEANMRSAALVGAAEYVHARLEAGLHGDNRHVIASVLQRADEPGEMLAYWLATYGRPIPKPIKRGIGDAATLLYNERSLLKHDTDSHGIRFGDVLDLLHPIPKGTWQSDLFRYAIDRRHNRENAIPESLPMVTTNTIFKTYTPLYVDHLAKNGTLADKLAEAGMTWEQLGSYGPWTAARWEAMIPSMGYMALLRNLRNFDQAGVSNKVAAEIAAKLADPDEVARSRQLPMRFLSAYKAVPSLRWAWPLEQALDHSLTNIPKLSGRTLILVDTSTSMQDPFSKDGTLMRWDAAALFGIALAARCADADIVSYSSTRMYYGDPIGARTKVFDRPRGESVLKSVERWKTGGWFLGGGTDTAPAVQRHFAGHDRVVLLTDEQAGSVVDPGSVLPERTPLYTWNLAGYKVAHTEAGKFRHTVGGLTDAGFRLIPLLESSRNGTWPWRDGAQAA
ncbi:TROVE domain-containing protein [Nocardia rhizosphaerae]|uniref:TROVE domain-containing protein n=1 Tax=Nocardia rhizosphaerae TaxID=1691571 RepID=A0ABV8LD97_9NOCA